MSFKTIPIEEKLIEVGGTKLFVRLEGSTGHPLVFLHGGPGSSHDYFAPYVEKLAHNRRLVLYDQRGCGRSERLSDHEYRIETFVEDIREVIQALGFSKVDLLGHSVGGFMAQLYALKYQDTIEHLILCCTGSNAIDSASKLEEIWNGLPARDKKRITGYLRKHERGQPYASEYVDYIQSLQGSAKKPPLDTQQYTSLIFAGFSWPVYASLMGGGIFEFKIDGDLKTFDMRKRLQEIKVPTLIIAGKYDGFTPKEARNMKRMIPNSKAVIFEKSGHWPFLEENRKFVSVLEKFLGS